jgi:hypothetical protein
MFAIPDRYTLQARLFPALLVILPISLAIAAWFPSKFPGYGFLVGLLSAFGLTVLLAQLGRDLGKKKEPRLYERWGGKPTTQLLRHRNAILDSHTKSRYHQRLSTLVPIAMPSAADEEKNPAACDEIYNSCTKYLLEKTRDKVKFNLLFSENINYGFRRNLWGMKPAGIMFALLGLLASIVPVIINWNQNPPPVAMAATVISALMLTWWLIRINKNWVKTAAFAYGERLLACCDVL